jgi:hypothetical protein
VEPNAEIYEGQVMEKTRGDDMCKRNKEKNNNVRSSPRMMKKRELSANHFLFEEALRNTFKR